MQASSLPSKGLKIGCGVQGTGGKARGECSIHEADVSAAGYMALTLLVESGWPGFLFAWAKSALQRCWVGLWGNRRRRQDYVSLDEESSFDTGDVEDEDVKAERTALQTGTALL
jgi:hypothetical protein